MSTTAFVLGGGGVLGATQVGMLRALLAAGITPDLVVGTSIGSVNGAFVAADPTADGVARLEELWRDVVRSGEMSESPVRQAARFARHGTHVMRRGLIPGLVERHLHRRGRGLGELLDAHPDEPHPGPLQAEGVVELTGQRRDVAGDVGGIAKGA